MPWFLVLTEIKVNLKNWLWVFTETVLVSSFETHEKVTKSFTIFVVVIFFFFSLRAIFDQNLWLFEREWPPRSNDCFGICKHLLNPIWVTSQWNKGCNLSKINILEKKKFSLSFQPNWIIFSSNFGNTQTLKEP